MKGRRHVNHARREVIAVAQGQTRTHTHARSKEMDRVERRLEGEVEALRERL